MTAGEGMPAIYLDDIFLAHRRYYKAADKPLFIFDADSNYDIIRAQQDIEAYINAKFSEPDLSFMANIVYFISAYSPVVY